jgi:hypothetical protein
MSGAFVIRNQLGHYWGKSSSWVNGTTPGAGSLLASQG